MPEVPDPPLPPLASPTPERPLCGLTVLVVDDSRFACEAVRLMCLRSGARLRRADSLAAAERHLRVYRPSVLLVDLGLPDGNGLRLIERLDAAEPRVPVILATSGDEAALAEARAAGADAVLAKPLESIGAFQHAILAHLPAERRPRAPRALSADPVAPDPMALMEDLGRASEVLEDGENEAALDYVARFVAGVAKSAHDRALLRAAERLSHQRAAGGPLMPEAARLAGLLQQRLQGRAAV